MVDFKAVDSTLKGRYILLLALVPLVAACISFSAVFRYGTPGFEVERTFHGLEISKVTGHQNPVQKGDMIVAINGMPYDRVLGLLLVSPVSRSSVTSVTVLRKREKTGIDNLEARAAPSLPRIQSLTGQVGLETGETYLLAGLATQSFSKGSAPGNSYGYLHLSPVFIHVTFSYFFSGAWPYLFLVVLFLFLGTVLLFLSGPDQPARLFFLVLCCLATTISFTIPSCFGLLQPEIVSLGFLGTTLSNWLAFGSFALFIYCFPGRRGVCKAGPLISGILYTAPALVSIVLSFFTTGLAGPFFSALQRFRDICLPLLFLAAFIRHLVHLYTARSPWTTRQLKLPLAGYLLTVVTYLVLFLFPGLILERPLISFRVYMMITAAILSSAYFVAMLGPRVHRADELISRGMACIMVVVVLTFAYEIFEILIRPSWEDKNFGGFFLFFLLLFVLVINIFFKWMHLLFYRYLFGYRTDDNKLLFDFSDKLTATLDLSELISLVIEELPRHIQVTGSALLLLEDKFSRLYPEHLRIGSVPWTESHLVHRFNRGEQIFFCNERYDDPRLNLELSQLREAGYYLALPLRVTRVIGVILLGLRKDRSVFTEHDIRTLMIFANQAAIALKNSLHHTSLIRSREQLEAMFSKVVQAEKMAAIGEMSTTLAHEIKNPLAIIRSSAQYLHDKERSPEIIREMLGYIVDEVDGLNIIVTNILGLAKLKDPNFTPIDIGDEIERLFDKWKGSADHNPEIILHHTIPRRLPLLYADLQQLRQMLMNLIRNSEEAMTGGGNIVLRVEREKEFVLFRLQDDGPGIDPGQVHDMFKKFFTTKKDGLGLGLNVCEQIVSAHQGSMSIQNRPEGGAEILVRLPFQPLATLEVAQEGMKDKDLK